MSEQTFTLAIRAGYLGFADQFRSHEETRYYLNGVYVEPSPGGGVLAIATDGHRLFAGRESSGVCAASAIVALPKAFAALCRRAPDAWVVARTPLVKRAALWLLSTPPEDAPGDPLMWEAPDGEFILARSAASIIDGDFPPWRKAMPKMPEKAAGPEAMQARYLADFRLAARWASFGQKSGHIIVAPSGNNGPVLIVPSGDHAEWTAVVMPMRFSSVASVPAWAAEPMAAVAETPKRKKAA